MLAKSKVSILSNASQPGTVFLDGLNFLQACWQLFYVNVNMIKCHTKFLKLDIGYSVNATLENSTFGYWSFADVQDIVIRNCINSINTDSIDSIDQDPITSLIFYNSSGLIENMTIKDLNFNHIHDGLIVDYYSYIQIINSILINNTVNYGAITVLNFGTLIMLDCVVQKK